MPPVCLFHNQMRRHEKTAISSIRQLKEHGSEICHQYKKYASVSLHITQDFGAAADGRGVEPRRRRMHVHSIRKKKESRERERMKSSASIGRPQEETAELKKHKRAEDICQFPDPCNGHANRSDGAHEPIAATQLFQLHSALASDTAVCVNVTLHCQLNSVSNEWKRCSAQHPVTSSCLVQVSWTETSLTPTAVPEQAASPSVLSSPPWEQKSHPTGHELRSANYVEVMEPLDEPITSDRNAEILLNVSGVDLFNILSPSSLSKST
ncbi:hypothetical protein PAMP_017258 [Pampus punctatissimus]